MTYDDLTDGGEEAVIGLIGRQETLQLEFKANEERDPIFIDGVLTKAGRRLLAREASAFANSAGGVIVFGVDCRTIDKIDQAEKLTPIPHLGRAETTVRDAASELLQPRHNGIRVSSIPTAKDSNVGFIIVDVPRSERRPHRSEAADQKQYFKRSGSGSFAMEHYDIEDAFRRTSSPELRLELCIGRGMASFNWAEFHLVLALRNVGEVTAKSITMQVWDDFDFASGSLVTRNTLSFWANKTHIAAPAEFVIHPSEAREFHRGSFQLSKSKDGPAMFNGSQLEDMRIEFSYTIGAEGMRTVNDRAILSGEDFDLVRNHFN